ncbi:MAG: hypothetical protein LBU15_04700 [Rickettsiales bacterium]|nr:hypothetical protein [Rickettsiales bacterium]
MRNQINDSLRAEIAEYKENYFLQNKDVRFSIDGKIELSMFPTIKLRVNNLNLSAVQYRNYSLNANVRKIELSPSFIGLLGKKLNITSATVSGVELTVVNDPLRDSYVKKETVKKMVKLGENEVVGLRDKLKTIFTGNSDIRDGYREVEVIEDRVVTVDNSKTRLMLLKLMKTLEISDASFSRGDINFSGMNIVYVSDGVARKEISSISGKLSLSRQKKLEAGFVLNNVAGNLSLLLDGDGDSQKFEVKLTSDLLDEIGIEYSGNNLLAEDFANLTASYRMKLGTAGFNNLLQWILPTNSKFHYYVDYKKAVRLAMEVEQDKSSLRIKKFSLESEDLGASGSFSRAENWEELEVNVDNLNLNGITLNVMKTKTAVDQDKISIFKIRRSDELFDIIRNTRVDSPIDSAVKINIKKMTKDSITLTDSLFDFEIIDGSYKMNNFVLNLNDMGIKVDNQREVNGFFISDLTVTGKNFDDIARFFNVPNSLGLKEFKLKSGVFVYNGTVYLTDYEVSGGNTKISGSVEYSIAGDSSYLAYIANLEEFSLNVGASKVLTMKENLLWLNNFTKNVFAELHIRKLKYNEKLSITDVVTKINYSPGFMHLYNIENMNFDFAEAVSGRILLDIRGKNPVLGLDLRIKKIKVAGNLMGYVFDVEKYRNLILKEPVNPGNQSKYWVNKLFTIPKFDEIGGRINIIVGSILVNDAQLSDLSLSTSLEEGVFAIRNFKFNGLGGTTELRGLLDLKGSKVVNLVLTETTYSIEEIVKLLSGNSGENGSEPSFKGTLGLGGLLKGGGPSETIFDASLDMQFKFVGRNLFIKSIGLDDLRKKLSMVYQDSSLLNMKSREIILNGSGTTFGEFSGLFTIKGGITDLAMDAMGEGISTKLALKIDNRDNDTRIDALNTSIILNRVGKMDIPLYLIVKFTENFTQKAQLEINTEQIDKYLSEIKRLLK